MMLVPGGLPIVSGGQSAGAIGVSGDTPAALADLMGILVNNGVRNPNVKIERLHFGASTPTETVMARQVAPGQQVIAPEIAALVRQQLIGVVENGTGRRAHGGISMPGGHIIPVGGKTGTGDNRLESFSANGRVGGPRHQKCPPSTAPPLCPERPTQRRA